MIEYITIHDTERQRVGIIDVFKSVLWARQYFGVGEFEVYVQATAENSALLKAGNYVSRDDDDEVGIIERVEKTFLPISGLMIIARGRFVKSLLSRRVIYRLSGNVNRPTVLSGKVETAVRSLVSAHVVSPTDAARQIPFVKLGELAGISHIITNSDGGSGSVQTSYANLLTFSDDLLQEYGMSARMTMDAAGNLLYTVFEGKDRSVGNAAGLQPLIFSQEFDNLSSTTYVHDGSGYKNTALVGGSGEELARFYILHGGSAAGMNRHELFIDARSINREYQDEGEETQQYPADVYTQMLTAEARRQLEPYAVTDSMTGEVDVTNSVYRYRQDYDLGDLVTIRDDMVGVMTTTRIVRIIEAQDENGYQIGLEFNA